MFVCQWHLDVPYGKQGEAALVPGTQHWVVYRVPDERAG